jgi:hypothetical protein
MITRARPCAITWACRFLTAVRRADRGIYAGFA